MGWVWWNHLFRLFSKAKLHIELLGASSHAQRVFCPVPVPGCVAEMLSLLSKQEGLSGHCAGCSHGVLGRVGAGRALGKFSVQLCHPDTFLPGVVAAAQSCSCFWLRKGPQVQFVCVAIAELYCATHNVWAAAWEHLLRAGMELSSGKHSVCTQTWQRLDLPFALVTGAITGQKWLHQPLFNLLFLEQHPLWEGSHIARRLLSCGIYSGINLAEDTHLFTPLTPNIHHSAFFPMSCGRVCLSF